MQYIKNEPEPYNPMHKDAYKGCKPNTKAYHRDRSKPKNRITKQDVPVNMKSSGFVNQSKYFGLYEMVVLLLSLCFGLRAWVSMFWSSCIHAFVFVLGSLCFGLRVLVFVLWSSRLDLRALVGLCVFVLSFMLWPLCIVIWSLSCSHQALICDVLRFLSFSLSALIFVLRPSSFLF